MLAVALVLTGLLWGCAAPAPVPAVGPEPATATTTPADCPPVAREPTPEQARQLAARARDRGLLWRVDHEGRTAWLYGTLHVARLEWVFPGPTVGWALQAADSLAMELDLQDRALMRSLQAGLRAVPRAPSLPADLAARLARQADAACVREAIASLRPDAQVTTLLALMGRRHGLDLAYGIDLALGALARALGKRVWALETPEQQLRELVSDEPLQVLQTVRAGLAQLERPDAAQQLLRLTEAWAAGDVDRLARYPEWCDCLHGDGERRAFARLVDGRNPAMAAQVARALREGQAPFVAVGALHLVGPQGLPALLAAQGFAVTPVLPSRVGAAAAPGGGAEESE